MWITDIVARNMAAVAALRTASPELTTGKFPTVALTFDTSSGEWVTTSGVQVFSYHLRRRLSVPAGFRFDLASVPRAAWWAIAPFELGIISPLFHDLLYRRRGKIPGGDITRKQADKAFAELMRREGISAWRRAVAYRALRIFGQRW